MELRLDWVDWLLHIFHEQREFGAWEVEKSLMEDAEKVMTDIKKSKNIWESGNKRQRQKKGSSPIHTHSLPSSPPIRSVQYGFTFSKERDVSIEKKIGQHDH